MDYEQLKRLIRESYPFPIAHAHKKTVGVLDDSVEKLKCILETAEVTIQFLALLALAQLRQDLLTGQAPNLDNLSEVLTLANPSFGKWNHLARETMKSYWRARDQLVVPELFELFWREDASTSHLRSQPLDKKVISPLITLRNAFHHGRVPDHKMRESVADGLQWLHQLLEAIQFVARYQLSFTQRILLDEDPQQHTCYIHDLMLFTGCVSVFDRRRWQSEVHLKPSSVIFLHTHEGRHLILNPFMIFTEQLKGVPDLFLLNNAAKHKAVYTSSQFREVLETRHTGWTEGPSHHEALREFFDMLPQVAPTSSPSLGNEFPSLEGLEVGSPSFLSPEEAGNPSTLRKTGMPAFQDDSPLSTAEVFQQHYRISDTPVHHTSPYKFLDYYNPEDHDIFFGRDKEIRILQQKFYNSRLLVLHGESGTGKTSLIRAGLIPRLDSESYIPVYVRMLKEPLQEITRELIHQLELEDGHTGFPQHTGGISDSTKHPVTRSARQPGFSLAKLLLHITERISKTVVIVLDQFEEFFLRFPEDVRQHFEAELAACIETPRLDVKFLISLRADYFSYLATFESSLPHIFTHQLQLEHLNEAQALEAVIKPSEQLGISVDEAMVQIKLLPELTSEEGGIEAPLLQIVCDALYQNAQGEGRQAILLQLSLQS